MTEDDEANLLFGVGSGVLLSLMVLECAAECFHWDFPFLLSHRYAFIERKIITLLKEN